MAARWGYKGVYVYGKNCQFSSNDEFSGFKLLAVKTFEITL